MANNVYVCHFDDYHEIEDRHKGMQNQELGCFSTKGYPYSRYYAVYWTGRKPSREVIIKKMYGVGLIGTVMNIVADRAEGKRVNLKPGKTMLYDDNDRSFEDISFPGERNE